MEDRIAEVEDVSIQQVILERAAIVQRAYDEARQKFPDHPSGNDWQGYVERNLLSREERDEEDEVIGWKAQVKARIPALVEALQDRGYQLRDIAFLVRDKKAGKEIVDTLMQYQYEGHAREGYRYDFISSESLFLNASLAVGLLVDVLRFLDNPQDALAKGSIAYKYRKLQGKEMRSDELHCIFSTAAKSVDDAKLVLFQ